MQCSHCGIQISSTDALCVNCGQPQSPPTEFPALATPDAGGRAQVDCIVRPLYGVGGWLLISIITLVFIGPAWHVANFIRSFVHNQELLARSLHPYSLYQFYFVEAFLGFAVYGYAIFAGIQLWKIREGAVQRAKRFLLILLVYRFLDYSMGSMWLILMTPDRSRTLALSHYLAGNAAENLVRTAIYVGIWYSYLMKSERVRATYASVST
ncbi:MAG TPA: DUF2569 family protein [Candidatus Acidoferrales bacterium]